MGTSRPCAVGVFIPVDQLPDSLVEIGRVFPLAHLAEGLQAAFGTGDAHLSRRNVVVLAIWGAAGIPVTVRPSSTPRAVSFDCENVQFPA